MEIFAMAADTFTLTNPQNLGFSNRHNTTTSSSTLTISASISPIDSIAPPITRPTTTRTIPRTCPQKKRRTRRRSQTADYDDGDDNGFFGGDGDDGSFGGSTGGGGGGGKGWSFYGGNEWEESASSSYSDPAFDFVFQVLSWIVLSNCLHFAFKKIFKVVGSGGFGDPSREKVPMRFISIC